MIKITEVQRFSIGEVDNYDGPEPRREVGMVEDTTGGYLLFGTALTREEELLTNLTSVQRELLTALTTIQDYQQQLEKKQAIIEKLRVRRTKAVFKGEALRKELLGLRRRMYAVLSDLVPAQGCESFGCSNWAEVGDRCKKHSPKPGADK